MYRNFIAELYGAIFINIKVHKSWTADIPYLYSLKREEKNPHIQP